MGLLRERQGVFEKFRDEMGKFPKRILFYRGMWIGCCLVSVCQTDTPPDGVSEGEFSTIITEELEAIRSAFPPPTSLRF
jgi:hypothetical protein